ncbi:MAG: hypothetical protein ACREMA_15170, partial [Longimicrobiales bacterium]
WAAVIGEGQWLDDPRFDLFVTTAKEVSTDELREALQYVLRHHLNVSARQVTGDSARVAAVQLTGRQCEHGGIPLIE